MSKGDDTDAIIANGISWGRGGASSSSKNDDKVKTKAKKKKYITGAHGSGSARQKAKYREQRANRNKKKKSHYPINVKGVQPTVRSGCTPLIVFAVYGCLLDGSYLALSSFIIIFPTKMACLPFWSSGIIRPSAFLAYFSVVK